MLDRHSAITQIFRALSRPIAPLSFQPATVYPACYASPAIALSAGYTQALEKLQEMKTWQEGWDGDDASPLSNEAAGGAQTALWGLSWQVPAPDVNLNSNGTVSLEWETRDGAANIEIGRTRYSGYVAPNGRAPQYFSGPRDAINLEVATYLHAYLFGSSEPSKPITQIEAFRAA